MNNKQWLLTEKERKLVEDYREACFSTDLIAIIDRLTSPPAPQAEGEIDRENPQFNQGVLHVVDLLAKTIGAKDWVHGDGSEDYDDDLAQTLFNILAAKGLYDKEDGTFAALRSAQAPARTYADGIEDAAKVVKGAVYKERYREWPQINWGNRDRDCELVRFADALAAAIRALANKAR